MHRPASSSELAYLAVRGGGPASTAGRWSTTSTTRAYQYGRPALVRHPHDDGVWLAGATALDDAPRRRRRGRQPLPDRARPRSRGRRARQLPAHRRARPGRQPQPRLRPGRRRPHGRRAARRGQGRAAALRRRALAHADGRDRLRHAARRLDARGAERRSEGAAGSEPEFGIPRRVGADRADHGGGELDDSLGVRLLRRPWHVRGGRRRGRPVHDLRRTSAGGHV